MSTPSALQLQLPPPKPLNTSGDTWLGWKTWKSEFTLFSTATQPSKQPKVVQAATLLVTIGEEGRKAYNSFKFETEEDRIDVNTLIRKFEDFYRPATNLTVQEFRFGSRDQKEGESFSDWLTELRILAKSCEFGELEERMLRSRIILSIRDEALLKKLHDGRKPYRKTVEMRRVPEQRKEEFRKISESAAHDIAVNTVAASVKPCSRWGYTVYSAHAWPAQGKSCNKCGRLNHFAQACKSPETSRATREKKANKEKKNRRELRVDDEDFFLKALSISTIATD
ncbi:uncharacterized protein LOC115328857 [Ixodes scapularis]|uniref:uncharacterized protein LOC115328857 n=1 Tax=Ixodes scapularis TaxID=6945 RepID=UPI001A9F6B4D|nr:uncharacterized protein LOC115328857 [Ixodes scapularis]